VIDQAVEPDFYNLGAEKRKIKFFLCRPVTDPIEKA
jgi:hypothetical protein